MPAAASTPESTSSRRSHAEERGAWFMGPLSCDASTRTIGTGASRMSIPDYGAAFKRSSTLCWQEWLVLTYGPAQWLPYASKPVRSLAYAESACRRR